MSRLQMIALLLWRGGLLLAGVSILFETVRYAVRWVDLPAQLEIGAGLTITGFALVMVSLIWERIEDAQREGDLRE